MLRYQLFGQTVTFDDPAERYCDLRLAARQASVAISQHFQAWYGQCGNIQSVLDGYPSFAASMIEEFAFRPLFDRLAECEIYDVSQDTYKSRCIGQSASRSALETVARQYNGILQQQSEKKEYRAERKAGRAHYRSYTSIHSDTWLADQLGTGVKNLATFAGHTLVNAVGNAGSAVSASMDKSALYKDEAIQDALLEGILADLAAAYQAHIGFLNEREEGYVRSVFNREKSAALLENAQKLPDKREELLVQAFAQCPWDPEPVKYVFTNFPTERDSMAAAAQRFSIDLSSCVEDIIAQEYNEQARSSEEAAQAAKARILAHMQQYGASTSQTLDTLETDCLTRLCAGYEAADEATCGRLMDSVRQYQAQEQLKPPFIERLQARITELWVAELTGICNGCEAADEATCERLLAELKAHRATEEVKAPFLSRVQARIESIWSAEDGEIFDNLYGKVDITDPKAVAEAAAYVQSKGRTDSSKKYLDALNGSTPQAIKNARLYRYTNRYKLYIVLAILCIFPGVTLPLTAFFLFAAWRMKSAWNLLTINGAVIPPALLPPPR